VETDASGHGRAAEDDGGLARRQPFPGDESKDLAVALAQSGKRRCERAVPGRRGLSWSESVCRGLPGAPAALVREHVSRHRVQPRKRIGWHAVEPAQADEERVRDDILDQVVGARRRTYARTAARCSS
jgi:hypothetical protein